jgi:hypothetical protein
MKEEIHRLDRLVRISWITANRSSSTGSPAGPGASGRCRRNRQSQSGIGPDRDRRGLRGPAGAESGYGAHEELPVQTGDECTFRPCRPAEPSRLSRKNVTAVSCWRIADTGTGVSRENLARVFEPFFTTKSQWPRPGAGMTKRVIEVHGGKNRFSSEEGQGSEVTISLPLADSQRRGSAKDPGEEQTWRSS